MKKTFSFHGKNTVLSALTSKNWEVQTAVKISLSATRIQLSGDQEMRVRPQTGRQHLFLETDYEIFSTVILSLPLNQEGQLSVSGKRMCTILVTA